MKKVFVIIISVMINATIYAGEPFAIHSFPSASITGLEIETIGGNITLTSNGSEESTVEVFLGKTDKTNAETDEEIKKIFDEYYTVNVRVALGKLSAVVTRKKKRPRNELLNVSFNINIPKNVSGKMKTLGGDISINGISGELEVKSVGGSFMLDGVSGKISGNTVGGNINLINSTANTSLTTVGGNINLTNTTADISLKTVGGKIQASNSAGEIHLNNVGGSVRVNDLKGDIHLSTIGENITVNNIIGTLHASIVQGTVEMKNISDTINLTLKDEKNRGYNLNITAENVKTTGMKDFSGKMNTETLIGTVGDGRSKIEISQSKQVNLSFK